MGGSGVIQSPEGKNLPNETFCCIFLNKGIFYHRMENGRHQQRRVTDQK